MKSIAVAGFAIRKLIWLPGIIVLLAASSAQASHGGIHPTFRSESAYFHCTGPTKIYTVNQQLVPFRGSIPWNTTAPAQSLTQGAGCGTLDTFLTHESLDNEWDVTFRGTFTGNIRDLTVQLHDLAVGRVRSTATVPLNVRLLIDGEHYLPLGTGTGTRVDVTPAPSSNGVTELFQFSVTDIGSAKEDGDGTTQHDIVVHLTPTPAPFNTAWVWDASEVASGITFNPATLAASTVAATTPS